MSEFSGYEKMPSSFKKLGWDEKDFAEMEKLKWVVTEKVHGANFSFVYEKGNLKFAKRKEYLSWDDDFFAFQMVVHRIESKVIRLFEDLSAQLEAEKYILYGELFGGEYPHPDVEAVPNLQAIQTGVYYSPDIHFCAFDIAIERVGQSTKSYLDYASAIGYFEKHGVFYAKPLSVGKFTDAVNFNTRIDSIIPQQLGLPALAPNLIEGVVIKPFEALREGSEALRPIVKLKNKEFEEEKFHQAEKWTYIPGVSSKSEELSFILDELRNYITPNRLESAVSKIGALDTGNPKRIAEIETEFLRDALLDFEEQHDALLNDLPEEDRQWLSERVLAEIRKVIAARA